MGQPAAKAGKGDQRQAEAKDQGGSGKAGEGSHVGSVMPAALPAKRALCIMPPNRS